MILIGFKRKDSHFWMSLSCGFALFIMGLVGIYDSLIYPIGLSWKVDNLLPISHLEEWPWSLFITVAGGALLLDTLRVFKKRKTRFGVWLYAMLVLWTITVLQIVTMVTLYPHTVGLALAYTGLTLSYTLLFLFGSPLVGATDLVWSENESNSRKHT